MLESIKAKAAGTNIATVLRLFVNNGSTPTTAANNALFFEASLAATTASATAATIEYEFWFNKKFPATYRVYAVIGTTVAAGWMLSSWGGNY